MGTTVPGSTAFSIRWHLSSSDWLKPYAEKYIFLPRGFIRPVFDFHDDGAGFQGADGVPLADGDVQGDYRAAGREFIIELLHQPTP